MEKLMMGVLILLTVLIILKQGLNWLNFWTLKQNHKLERQLAAQRRSDQTQDDVTDDEGREEQEWLTKSWYSQLRWFAC